MKCPHCGNADPRLMEKLVGMTNLDKPVEMMLCHVCSKVFNVKERTND